MTLEFVKACGFHWQRQPMNGITLGQIVYSEKNWNSQIGQEVSRIIIKTVSTADHGGMQNNTSGMMRHARRRSFSSAGHHLVIRVLMVVLVLYMDLNSTVNCNCDYN